jgi:SAM-dependent methyltransferase
MTSKHWIQRSIPAAVSVGALGWLFVYGGIDFRDLIAALNWKVASVLVPALLVYGAVTLLLEARSIVLLVKPAPSSFGIWTVARIKSASYLLGIVNYTLGVAALALLLSRRAAVGLGRSASVVLLISSLDLVVVLTLGAIGAVSMALSFPARRELIVGMSIVAGIGLFGGIALLRVPGSFGPLERIRSLAVFEALRTTPLRSLASLGLLRLLFCSTFLAVSGAAFLAFDITPPLGQFVAGMTVVAVVSALPIAVAGLGTSQWAVLSVFGNLADDGTLVAMSLVLSAGMILLRASMGLIFAREFTREALAHSRAEQVTDLTFTGERLHTGSPLFSMDLARHQAAYELIRSRAADGQRVLELGSGSGYGAAALAEAGVPIVAIDRVAPDPRYRGGACAFLRGDLNQLPLAEKRFEWVVSFQVIEHLEDTAPYVDAIAQLLSPTGTAILATPNRLQSDGVNPYHVHEYVADELASCMGRRFRDVEILGIGTSDAVRQQLEERSARIRRIMRLDPWGLRDRLPRPLMEWLFARFAVLVRFLGRSKEAPAVSWRDFPVGPHQDDCLDLVAVCRRPE